MADKVVNFKNLLYQQFTGNPSVKILLPVNIIKMSNNKVLLETSLRDGEITCRNLCGTLTIPFNILVMNKSGHFIEFQY